MAAAAPFNFGGLPRQFSGYENSRIVVLPVPFDKTSSWLKGADKGPKAVVEASRNLELFDIETRSEVYRRGIYTAPPVRARDSESLNQKVRGKVRGFLADGKFVVALGGDHSISLGAVAAYSERYPGLSVLHLDAHADMRDCYLGNKFSHACIMKRVMEITGRTVSVGIRSMDSSEAPFMDKGAVFYAEDIYASEDWIERACRRLGREVYVTIDLDVFDPGIMPSTGTPEPGGLQWYPVLKLLKRVSLKRKIVGIDVVELCPSENKAPDFLAAKLIYKLLSYTFERPAPAG